MSNVISFDELIGTVEVTHRVTVNNRVILYGDPTLESLVAIRKMGESTSNFGVIYETAEKVLRGQTFEDGEPFDLEWFNGVSLGEFIHFMMFMSNPSIKEKPAYGSPLTIHNLRGRDVVLPPITLGNIKFFNDFLYGEGKSELDVISSQLEEAFAKAKLSDGSPLPDDLLSGLTPKQAQALVNRWIRGPADEEVKKAKNVSATSGKKKRGGGTKLPQSSRTSTDSASSEVTPTTSESSN